MADEMYDNLWERTKRKPGYVVDLGFQFLIILSVFEMYAETAATSNNLALTIVYGLVIIVTLEKFAPRVGGYIKTFTNGLADLYWETREQEGEE